MTPSEYAEIAKKTKVLIIDDEAPIREVLLANLEDDGFIVSTAHDGEAGLKALREFQPEICFLDIWMPGKLDGLDVLNAARKDFPSVEFVMISGHGTIETAVKATKLGAWDFIEKPLSMDKISIVITNILQFQQEKEEKNLLLNKLRRSIALVGEASAMMTVKQLVAKVAPTHSWLLLAGANGVGKRLAAQNIHYMSPRASRPFVDVNCSTIPEELMEAELFGIEKGALPGAERTQKGKVELALGGTLYLSEVTDLSLEAQNLLLGLLQTKTFSRLGGSEKIPAEICVIASTTKDIEKLVAAGSFNKELWHRLSAIPFRLPALTERSEDIPALISYFSDHVARESGSMKKAFSDRAIQLMMAHQWPGNVRELKNFIERLYILTPTEFIDIHDLRFAGLVSESSATAPGFELNTFREARAQFEKEYLISKINENNGNISKTAEVIGLERSYLHRKIKSYGIDVRGSDSE